MSHQTIRSFASDNNAGVHPDVMQAIVNANNDHVVAYGDDPYTEKAISIIQEQFGCDCDVYFVFGGTGANVLSLKQATQSHHAVICAESAHINVDECGAPENYTGCKMLTVPTTDGKLTIAGISKHIHGIGFEHHAQPKVISITQATEYGTIYTPDEIERIADYAHLNNLYLHVDGARLCNAAVALNLDLNQLTADCGVDFLSFGGTKNGLMMGESVIFFNKKLSETFKYTRKQGMQLMSKMRYVGAQFIAFFEDNLWRTTARHANAMAKRLEATVQLIPEIQITQSVESNAIFARIPPEAIEALQECFFFYVWDESRNEVRWMTSFDTTENDITQFVSTLKRILHG